MEAAAVIVMVMAAGLAAAGAALTLASWLAGRGDGQEAWSAAVRRAGLAALEERPGEMAGWSGRLHVSLSRYRRSTDAAGTLITVSGPGLAGPALTIRPESFETGLLHRSGRHDVETGDADFDRSVWAEGDEARVLAVLDAPTRAALRVLVHGQLARPGRASFWASGWFENGTAARRPVGGRAADRAPPARSASAGAGRSFRRCTSAAGRSTCPTRSTRPWSSPGASRRPRTCRGG